MTLRWKKNPMPTGLARIACGPQGSTLRDGDVRYATTGCMSYRRGRSDSWYWVAGWGSGVEHKNTHETPVADEATAKAEAMAYVKAELERLQPQEQS